jgi:hypothetical protein
MKLSADGSPKADYAPKWLRNHYYQQKTVRELAAYITADRYLNSKRLEKPGLGLGR